MASARNRAKTGKGASSSKSSIPRPGPSINRKETSISKDDDTPGLNRRSMINPSKEYDVIVVDDSNEETHLNVAQSAAGLVNESEPQHVRRPLKRETSYHDTDEELLSNRTRAEVVNLNDDSNNEEAGSEPTVHPAVEVIDLDDNSNDEDAGPEPENRPIKQIQISAHSLDYQESSGRS